MQINIHINLKADSAKQAIEQVNELKAHFGNDIKTVAIAPRMAPSGTITGNTTKDMITRSKARMIELGLTRAPKATSREMSLRTQHDATGDRVNWSLDLVTRETIMRDGYDYDIYADNKGKTGNDAPGATFDESLDDSIPED